GRESRLTELDPAALRGHVLHLRRHVDVVGGAEPAFRVHVVDVESTALQPYRPASGDPSGACITRRQGMTPVVAERLAVVFERLSEGCQECLDARVRVGEEALRRLRATAQALVQRMGPEALA